MAELRSDRFDEFFEQLWERTAFSWQRELARRVIANVNKPWPDAIALPTASGKTACIDIAIFALAAQAERLESRQALTAARRIFFVVDRRIIVDEAYERARVLAARLHQAKEGILKEVADRLRWLARGEREEVEKEIPLAVFQLRGGMYRSEAWARSPLQPTIVASTVDQIGSRLLFRAYGRGPGMWPVYAGLAGNDSLILLDEAHCAQPFLQTLQAVSRYRIWAEEPLPTCFYPVVMSATPPPGLGDIFCDNSDEPSDPDHPLGKRQLAYKPTALKIVEKAKGENAISALAAALVNAAENLVQEQRKAVVIFTNRVATARHAHKLLTDKHGDRAVLLTGRMRPIDKDDTIAERLKPLSSDRSAGRKLDQGVFVVATQTLEVGADLDFDALVTECASLDALRQRFGRLNRMGREIEGRDSQGRPVGAKAVVLIRADQVAHSKDDPVYGTALANTWKWLNNPERLIQNDEFDFGIGALATLLKDYEPMFELNAPSTKAAVMLPAHIDCWAQTSPEPFLVPDVAPFLRGTERGDADVQVCWRADIDLRSPETESASKDTLILCPPSSAECLPVPIALFKRWMANEEGEDQTADVELAGSDENDLPFRNHETWCVLRWRGREEVEAITKPEAIRPGDIVVIPTYSEGWNILGDIPQIPGAEPMLDCADRAHRQVRAKAQLRLHPGVISQWPECTAKGQLRELIGDAQTRYEGEPDSLFEELIDIFRSVGNDESAPFWLREITSTLAVDKRVRQGTRPHPLGGGLIVQGSHRLPTVLESDDRFSDESDATASGTAHVPLFEHLPGVAAYAKRFAAGCCLPKPLTDALERAGLLHDLGKADPRFQALLRNGNPWVHDVLLAKSEEIPQSRTAYERARKTARYPQGGRHELLSVRLTENTLKLLPQDETLRALILHLVASHHGYCRPFAPVVFDDAPIDITVEFEGHTLRHSSDTRLEQLDSGVAERFWRMIHHYGWWGVAWLEAILRLADHRRSEAEMVQSENMLNE